MSLRSEHKFVFTAGQIAQAAQAKAEYHEARAYHWREEQDAATQVVRNTAYAEVKEQAITGGKRVDVVVNYGDPAAYKQMQTAFSKWQNHDQLASEFDSDAALYGSQPEGREYELSSDDAFHYGLA